MTYLLRTCRPDGRSSADRDFRYPLEVGATVEAPDWDPSDRCGGGLHGLRDGVGNGGLLDWSSDAVWLVLDAEDVVDVTELGGGKSKFRRATVVHVGDRDSATGWLDDHGCADLPVVGATRVGGDGATVTGGDYATVAGGNGATVAGGYGATVTGGYRATVAGGYRATVAGGNGATVTGGHYATVTGGNRATVAGGNGATVTGGDYATVQVRWWDGTRYRIATGYVGEDGIEPDTPYRCVSGKLVKVDR